MALPPESYVDSMPCDPDLLLELGRVTWAAARLTLACGMPSTTTRAKLPTNHSL